MSGKRIREAKKLVSTEKLYSLDEALDVFAAYAKKFKTKFDETVDVVLKTNGAQPDNFSRGAVTMPNGLGKSVRVAVICEDDKQKGATKAGAEIVGSEDLIETIKSGKIDFDVLIATPSLMVHVSKLGKVLGPKGLMPNPKLGTVAVDVEAAVKNAKAGQSEYKLDKAGLIHAAVGKLSFDKEALKQNLRAYYNAVMSAKPTSVKGIFIEGAYLSTSMGVSIKLDTSKVLS